MPQREGFFLEICIDFQFEECQLIGVCAIMKKYTYTVGMLLQNN